MNIIFWIIASFLASLSWAYWKKALNVTSLPNSLLALLNPLIWIFIIYLFALIFWINTNIFFDKNILFLLLLWWLLDWFWALLEVYSVKNTKVSKLIPYSNFDKLFIVLLGFLFFYWNYWYTSFTTLIITIITLFIIMLFSLDFKKISIEKEIKIYILSKFLYASTTLIISKILFEYSTLDIFSVIIFYYIIFHTINNILLKRNFTLILKQEKIFYKYRLISSTIWRIAFIISILLIESSWVLIASLLSFISIVFWVIFMKYILWDVPNKKQIFLSVLVIIMIGIWYYFR